MSNYKHGMRRTKLFGIWTAMLARCRNPNTIAYKDYGGRGITVCDSWTDFRNFYADMGEPPEGMTLDRTDNNQGYSKANCKWVSRLEQGRNKRNNRVLTVDGQKKTMSEWAEVSGLKITTIWARIDKGWTEVEAVKTPVITIRKGIKRGQSLRNFGAQHGVTFEKERETA